MVQTLAKPTLPARLGEFIAKVDRLEAAMWRHNMTDADRAQRELNEAIALAAMGDYTTAEQTFCDWEATVAELLDGPLDVDLVELRSKPRTGLPADQAMAELWAEVDRSASDDRRDAAA